MDSYKHLEKLCGEVLNDDRRVSAYIDEMLRLSRGAYLVKGWDDDLKKLKHYRWVRNQIVHDPNCTEENMCGFLDVQWLDDFYFRIMDQTDPLALYRKAVQPHPKAATHKSVKYTYALPPETNDRPRFQPWGCLLLLFGAMLMFIVALFLLVK